MPILVDTVYHLKLQWGKKKKLMFTRHSDPEKDRHGDILSIQENGKHIDLVLVWLLIVEGSVYTMKIVYNIYMYIVIESLC